MSTCHRVRTWASDDEDDEELILPTAVNEGAGALPAEQSAVRACGASPSLEALVRDAHGCLAELLQTASSILAELRPLSAAAKEGAAESSGRSDSAGISQRWPELAHQVVAAAAGSSAMLGFIEGMEIRMLFDTGASSTIISELV
ncbi:unnamed protein product [Lampetra planeri]